MAYALSRLDQTVKAVTLLVGLILIGLAALFVFDSFRTNHAWRVGDRISKIPAVWQSCELRVKLIEPKQVRPYKVAAVAVPATATDLALYPANEFGKVAPIYGSANE